MQIPEPQLVDAHAHICDAAFDGDRDEVLARTRKAGVEAIIAVGENLFDARRNLDLTKAYPMLRAAAGLYPSHLNLDRAAEIAAFAWQTLLFKEQNLALILIRHFIPGKIWHIIHRRHKPKFLGFWFYLTPNVLIDGPLQISVL